MSAPVHADASQDAAIPFGFVALMAVLLALPAFSIDTIIPAMATIAKSYQVTNANDAQLLISSVLLGMAIGQLLFGSIADAFGRKNAMYIGIGLYVVSCVAAIFAPSFELLVISRFVQGFGSSSTRISPVAMVRDRYKGPAMARIMSIVVSIFILVPAIAPLVGQAILEFASWHTIFIVMVVMSVVSIVWLWLGIEETLPPEKRSPFSMSSFVSAAREAMAHPITRGYTIASGFVFGALISYLNSSQQLLQFQYGLGENFVFAFGGLALSLGVISFANSFLVKRFGLKEIVLAASIIFCFAALTLAGVSVVYDGHPPFIVVLSMLSLSFMTFGALFGNYNAMAIAPMGHIAGVATSVTSFCQSVMSVTLGGFVAYLYDGTTLPLGLGFAVLATLNLLQIYRLHYHPAHQASAAA